MLGRAEGGWEEWEGQESRECYILSFQCQTEHNETLTSSRGGRQRKENSYYLFSACTIPDPYSSVICSLFLQRLPHCSYTDEETEAHFWVRNGSRQVEDRDFRSRIHDSMLSAK